MSLSNISIFLLSNLDFYDQTNSFFCLISFIRQDLLKIHATILHSSGGNQVLVYKKLHEQISFVLMFISII